MKTRNLAISLALATLAVVVFRPTLGNQFVNFDDNLYVYENPLVREGLTLRGFAWSLTGVSASNWHPLTWLSHMADVQMFGLNPQGHHLVNLLLHAGSAALLFLVLHAMIGAWAPTALVAALFAVHPLHVESVAWVAERKDVLSTLLWLATVALWLRYVRRPAPRRYLPVIFAYALGLMSKPMLVTLPLVLLVFDWWPLNRLGPSCAPAWPGSEEGRHPSPLSVATGLVREKFPLFLLAAVSSAITIIAQRWGGSLRSLENISFPLRVANAFKAAVFYLEKTFWPTDLAVLYPLRPNGATMWQAAASLALLAGVTALCLRWRPRRPFLLAGWLWYLVTLLPVIGLIQAGSQAMADRYTYLPLTGVFLMLALILAEVCRRRPVTRVPMTIIAVTIVVALSALSRRQLHFWRDSVTLFSHALDVTQGNAVAHNNLGYALSVLGRQSDAAANFEEALRIDPRNWEAHANLGKIMTARGQGEKALEHYQAAVRLAADFPFNHYNLANALAALGRVEEALLHYAEALRLKADFPEAHVNMGNLLLQEGRLEEALANHREAVRLTPGNAVFRYNLGLSLALSGDIAGAAAAFGEAVRIMPSMAMAHFQLGSALARQGRLEEAGLQFRETLRIQPDYEPAREAMARLSGATSGVGR
jgi:tetratricopeptide (TPR) repeat protein